MVSPRTWQQDAGRKRNICAAMGVTEYWRFDPRGDFFVPELMGEQLSGGEYRTLPLQEEADGTLWGHSTVLGLDSCSRPGLELRLYDPAAGQWILTPEEGYEAHREAEAALKDAEEENRRLREQIRLLQAGQ